MPHHPRPAFVSFTGADRADLIDGMHRLAAAFPIEWGVLVHPDKAGQPLYPSEEELRAFRRSGLRLAAHICGAPAQAVVEGRDPELSLGGVARAQINHGFEGSRQAQIANACAFGARRGVRPVLQCQGAFPADQRVDWLYDVSFGAGVTPTSWPTVPSLPPFCGLSGGLGPDTVVDVLTRLSVADTTPFWIDMESGIRTDGAFDLEKCHSVCRAIYGEDAAP